MSFVKKLKQNLDEMHLLKHPFYQAWTHGELSLQTLQVYAKEYYHHVAAFPRYISAIHSQCADLKMRQILLANLVEEEEGTENHPELWKRFAQGLGVKRETLQEESLQLQQTKDLVSGYFNLAYTDFATGLGALYAYERQTPAVSQSKIEGLKKFYSIVEERTLQFFTVHMQADEWHSQECAHLLEALNEKEQEKAMQGATVGAKLLWSFLDGMMEVHAS